MSFLKNQINNYGKDFSPWVMAKCDSLGIFFAFSSVSIYYSQLFFFLPALKWLSFDLSQSGRIRSIMSA